jgi:hypothetical protein
MLPFGKVPTLLEYRVSKALVVETRERAMSQTVYRGTQVRHIGEPRGIIQKPTLRFP